MIKLQIGGSPCTYWSIAQKNGRETEASGIGWELFNNYLIAKEKFNPDFFLYENNKSAAQTIKDQIAKEFGVTERSIFDDDNGVRMTEINSALVSAQNRQRFYVTNFGDIEQPEDRGILLRDILDSGTAWKEKSYCLDAHYAHAETDTWYKRVYSEIPGKQQHSYIAVPVGSINGKSYPLTASYIGAIPSNTLEHKQRTMIAEPVGTALNINPSGNGINGNVSYVNGKSRCVTTNKGEGQKIIEPVCVAQRGRYSDSGNQYKKTDSPVEQYYEAREDGKTNALTTVSKDNAVAEPIRVGTIGGESQSQRVYSCDGKSVNITSGGGGAGAKTGLYACPSDGKHQPIYEVRDGLITIKDKQYPIKLQDGYYIIRKLTVTECCRLQTMPDDYCRAVSDSQAYKGLGNGWTAEVIIHLLLHALRDVPRDEPITVLSMYDGIGTGRYCLDKMGFTNVTYHAYEIDKYAIKVAMSNYPDIVQHGDAFQVRQSGWKCKGEVVA